MLAKNAATEYYCNRFEKIKEQIGCDMATFVMCAACDIPYHPELTAEHWESYCGSFEGASKTDFADGVTDVQQALRHGMTDVEQWESEWGVGDDGNHYNINDYKRLDELFESYSERLKSAGGFDRQQEDTLRHCCRLALLRDKCVAKGGKESVDMAAKLDKMIQENLGSENLRKKDAKPIESARVDGIVDALRKKYGVGVELTYEQAVEVCAKWMVSHKYPFTMDAAEQMLLSIANSMRVNNDLPEWTELPDGIGDFSKNTSEFAALPNQAEKDAYKYLNLSRGSTRKPLEKK